jgi:hypothetical protein
MATFDEINQKGKVTVSEVITDHGEKEYQFEFTKYDADTGDLMPATYVENIREGDLIETRARLVARRDEEVVRYNAEIAEIDARLTAISTVKT